MIDLSIHALWNLYIHSVRFITVYQNESQDVLWKICTRIDGKQWNTLWYAVAVNILIGCEPQTPTCVVMNTYTTVYI